MDLGLNGKKALVTGGSSGLGFGAAKSLVAEGARVIIASRSEEKLRQAAATLGSRATYKIVDLRDPSNAKTLIQECASELDGLDILICNSGGPRAGGFYDVGIEDYQNAINSNMLASIELSMAAVPYMERTNWGRIIAITSLWVRQPSPNLILSNTARTGLTAFVKTMAHALAAKNITANTIQPGFHQTDRLKELNGDNMMAVANQVPAKRLGSPEDFGAVIAFLCSEQAKYITGVSLPVDGGIYSGLM
ncbi:MAG: SDR family oxidoreductase [Acidimicrobiaceae bacterium]|nr:SDR family oxidoreductase [Acidimicrobiaceae bacterium]